MCLKSCCCFSRLNRMDLLTSSRKKRYFSSCYQTPFNCYPQYYTPTPLLQWPQVCHEQVPVIRCVKKCVPIQRCVRTQVPVQRCVYGTREVIIDVTVNRPKCETYTQMVPQEFTRWINVPCVEKKIQHVPTVNYVTEMREKIDYVTEMQEKIDYVTEYVAKPIQVCGSSNSSVQTNNAHQQNQFDSNLNPVEENPVYSAPVSSHLNKTKYQKNNLDSELVHENIVLPANFPSQLTNKNHFYSSLSPVQENSGSFNFSSMQSI